MVTPRSEHRGDEDEQVADDFPYPSSSRRVTAPKSASVLVLIRARSRHRWLLGRIVPCRLLSSGSHADLGDGAAHGGLRSIPRAPAARWPAGVLDRT